MGKVKKGVGNLIIILGLGVILFPLAGRWVANQRQEAMMSDFYLSVETGEELDQVSDQLDGLFEEANEVDQQESLEETFQDIVDLRESGDFLINETQGMGTMKKRPDAIGVLRIPKIDLVLPILEGTSDESLRFGIGHMTQTAPLNQVGNVAIAGHRGHSFGVYLNRLDELENGDKITVETKDSTLTYRVYESLLVTPDDLSVLRGSSDHKVLTVITCDPVFNPTHRLIVHGISEK